MGRRIVSLLAGIATGLIIIYLLRVMGNVYYTFPEGSDWNDAADRAAYISSLPDSAFVFMVSSHVLGAFLAGLISALVSKKARFTNGIMAATVIFVVLIVENFTHEYPEYYLMIDILAVAIAGFLGAAFGRSRTV